MPAPHGFWVVVNDNRVFDGVVTRHVAAHADFVALNAFHESAAYSFSNIVGRLHAAAAGIRVLNYTWAGRKHLDGQTIGAVPTLDGMENLPDLLLKGADGVPIVEIENGRFIFLDPRVAEARAWLSDRVSVVASDVGSDGVALDSAIRTPSVLRQVADAERYPPAFDSMIRGISDVMPLTIFNNLSTRPDQERLLAFAAGASIEFFGLNDTTTRQPTFSANILPYLDAIGRHGDRTFLVFGRAPRGAAQYTTYEEDWRWQRYLYCAYLLAAGPNTRWKQHAGFLSSPPGGRAGGLDVYNDALHEIGSARGDYAIDIDSGVYSRVFERGVVLVLPAESRIAKVVWIGRPMFTPEGASVPESITVRPGEGHLLLRRRPAAPPALLQRFNPDRDPRWRWSKLRQESSTWYLHLDRTPDGEEHEHDLALDLVRHRAPRWSVTLSYRTSDPSARVETVVEVDDRDRMMRFVLVDGARAIGTGKPRGAAQFRAAALQVSQFARLQVVGGGTPMIADGRWRRLHIDLGAACTASRRYTFRRAVFTRFLGSMDIRELRLAGRRAVPIGRQPARRRKQ